MTQLILSRRELDFVLFEWLRVQDRTTLPRFAEHSRQTFDAVLDLAEQVATRQFATHNQRSDANEPRLVDGTVVLIDEIKTALDAFGRSGLLASTFDDEYGGMQLPQTVAKAAMLWFQAANTATSAYPFLTIANANLLIAHGGPELVGRWVTPMVEGRFFGTMCLSETQAGSSLADLTTMATPAGDSTFRLTGKKMWISAGDHELSENIVHLVLARIPGRARRRARHLAVRGAEVPAARRRQHR